MTGKNDDKNNKVKCNADKAGITNVKTQKVQNIELGNKNNKEIKKAL